MSILAFNHAALLVSEVERSRRFYMSVLELEEAQRPATMTFPGAWLRRGDVEIHLIGEFEPGRAAQVNPGYRADEQARGFGTHLAFAVDDLEATKAHLRELDVPIVGGPQDRGDGVTQIYIADPDGYLIEFFVFPQGQAPAAR